MLKAFRNNSQRLKLDNGGQLDSENCVADFKYLYEP